MIYIYSTLQFLKILILIVLKVFVICFDKVALGTYNFVSVICNVAFFVLTIAGLSPCAANKTVPCVKTQLLDQVKVKDTSQLSSGILKLLQKLIKCSNITTISASAIVLLLFGVFPVILVSYLKDSQFLSHHYPVHLCNNSISLILYSIKLYIGI